MKVYIKDLYKSILIDLYYIKDLTAWYGPLSKSWRICEKMTIYKDTDTTIQEYFNGLNK